MHYYHILQSTSQLLVAYYEVPIMDITLHSNDNWQFSVLWVPEAIPAVIDKNVLK